VTGPRVVALGGGHGLAASLQALRRLTDHLTAVVTVADDGGSSGRLRQELGVLPPGDLRMALAALCGDDDWGRTWSRVVQHRFAGHGELQGHAVGNLLIVALWEIVGDDPVEGLDWVARLLGCSGRVLPMSSEPLQIVARVQGAVAGRPDEVTEVWGQVEVAATDGNVVGVRIEPAVPRPCEPAVQAVREAEWVVLGPGSWFTSVIPHLLVPDLADALVTTPARRVVVLNLAPEPGETPGFSPQEHLRVLHEHAPGLRLDVVLADSDSVADPALLQEAAAAYGARVVLARLRAEDGSVRHDPVRLRTSLGDILGAVDGVGSVAEAVVPVPERRDPVWR
jgi:uncharacterized cofD-like protein